MIGPVLMFSDLYPEVILHPGAPSACDYEQADKTVGVHGDQYFFKNRSGDQLHGLFFRCPGAGKVVIYHHGNAGNLATRAGAYRAIIMAGASVFAYDYRGYGKSSGHASLKGVVDDGVAAYDFVHDQLHCPAQDIINYGESLGAGPAGYVTAHRRCGGIILQSGVPSLPEVGKFNFWPLRIYPGFFFPQPQMDNVSMADSFHCPISVMCGGKDTMIPWHLGKEVYDRASPPKRFVVLNDSHHNAVESQEDLDKYIDCLKFVILYGTASGVR